MIHNGGERVSAQTTPLPKNCIPHFVTLFGSLFKRPSSMTSSSTPSKITLHHSLAPLPFYAFSPLDLVPHDMIYIMFIVCSPNWDVSTLMIRNTLSCLLLCSQHLELCLTHGRHSEIFSKITDEWMCSFNPMGNL